MSLFSFPSTLTPGAHLLALPRLYLMRPSVSSRRLRSFCAVCRGNTVALTSVTLMFVCLAQFALSTRLCRLRGRWGDVAKNAPQISAGPWNERVGLACALALLPSTPRCQPGRMLGPTNMRRIKSLTVSPETNVISTAPTFRPHPQPVGLQKGLDLLMRGMNCRYSVGLPHLPV